MRTYLVSLIAFFLSAAGNAQDSSRLKLDTGKVIHEVEAACGQCKFGLPGKSCDLAIRMNGRSYFVDGTHIDKHGDAHASDGFCNAIRKAKVQGEIVGDRFKATWFELVAEKKKSKE